MKLEWWTRVVMTRKAKKGLENKHTKMYFLTTFGVLFTVLFFPGYLPSFFLYLWDLHTRFIFIHIHDYIFLLPNYIANDSQRFSKWGTLQLILNLLFSVSSDRISFHGHSSGYLALFGIPVAIMQVEVRNLKDESQKKKIDFLGYSWILSKSTAPSMLIYLSKLQRWSYASVLDD